MTPLKLKSSSSQRSPQNRSRLQQVFGNPLKVEEKVQVLDALISTVGQSYEPEINGNYKSSKLQLMCYHRPRKRPTFKSLSDLTEHKRTDHSDYCDKVFSQPCLRESYRNVVKLEHKRFSCQLCDKRFNRKSDLCTHIATHLSLRGYVCEICGRSFSHISNLIRHSHIHSGLKPYPCKICGKRFRQTSALLQHRISHHSAQLILCPANSCDKKFRTPVIARKHAYREHPDASFEDILPNSSVCKKQRCFYCKICGDQFQDLKNLKAHNLGHVKEKGIMVDENQIVTPPERVHLLSKAQSESHSGDPKIFSQSNSIQHSDVCNTDAHVSEIPKISEKLHDQDVKKNSDSGFSISAKSNDNFVDESESQSCSFSEKRGSSHSIGDFNASLIKLVSNPKIYSIPGQAIHSEINDINSPVDCLLESIHEIHRPEENLSVQNDVESEIEGSKLKDGCVDEDLLGSGDSSNVTFDVNMGLCPDSPNNTLDDHQLTELHCSNEADEIQCCDGKDNYKNSSDLRSELNQVKCSLQDTEPLMLSFGDSYLTLLKEIGIVEEDIDGGVEKLKNSPQQGHDETVDPLSTSFWGCYPTVPPKELVYNNEREESASSSATVQETNSQSNEMVKKKSQTTSAFVQELPEANCNMDSGLADNCMLTMEFSDNIIPLLPNSTNRTQGIIIYVAQDTEVQLLPIRNATTITDVTKSVSQDFRNRAEVAYCAQDTEQLNSENPQKSKNDVKKKCLVTNLTRTTTGDQETSPTGVKLKRNLTKMNQSTRTVALEEPAIGTEEEVHVSLKPLTESIKFCNKKPNRTRKECPDCGKVFFKGSNLTQHLGLHYPNMKQYKCELCDQSFSWKSSLNKHVTSHAVVLKQFLCDVCGKQYKSLDQVKQHKRRDHQSLRPHNCVICSKSFFRKYDLTVHERIHSNNKPYMCETCGKTFNHLSHMKRHENVHYKEKTI